MFHTYVASVCFRCFICFIRMLHSCVLCCTRFMLFGELGGARSDGGTAWAWRAGCRRSGHDGGGLRVRGEANGLESRRIGRVASVR